MILSVIYKIEQQQQLFLIFLFRCFKNTKLKVMYPSKPILSVKFHVRFSFIPTSKTLSHQVISQQQQNIAINATTVLLNWDVIVCGVCSTSSSSVVPSTSTNESGFDDLLDAQLQSGAAFVWATWGRTHARIFYRFCRFDLLKVIQSLNLSCFNEIT